MRFHRKTLNKMAIALIILTAIAILTWRYIAKPMIREAEFQDTYWNHIRPAYIRAVKVQENLRSTARLYIHTVKYDKRHIGLACMDLADAGDALAQYAQNARSIIEPWPQAGRMLEWVNALEKEGREYAEIANRTITPQ